MARLVTPSSIPVRVLVAALLSLPLIIRPLRAQEAVPSEFAVKAAFLYNFAKFVEWPADQVPVDRFVICTYGQPFGPALHQTFADKTIQDKPIVVRSLRAAEDPQGCQVLFVSAEEEDRVGEIVRAVQRRPILTVGDTPSFVQQGGILGFVLVRNNVRFNANLDAAARSGLSISSQLLKVAHRIIGGPPQAKLP